MTETVSAEQWVDSMRLPAIKWIWIWSLAHLAKWDSCLAGRPLEPISYEHGVAINLIFRLRRVPRLIPVLPQTRQPPTQELRVLIFGVIIIAFINRGCTAEQCPASHFTPRNVCVCVCVCVFLLMFIYERVNICCQNKWLGAAGQDLSISRSTFAELASCPILLSFSEVSRK